MATSGAASAGGLADGGTARVDAALSTATALREELVARHRVLDERRAKLGAQKEELAQENGGSNAKGRVGRVPARVRGVAVARCGVAV